MVYALTVILVYIIIEIGGFPVESSEKYSRNILLRELLNFQLPKDSNFQSISSLSSTAWNPTLSALLWTSWSKWERCTQNKYCVNNKTENIDNLIFRMRVCQFQSINEQLLWSQTMIKGINLSDEIIPCSEEGLIQNDVKHCQDLYQCIYKSHDFAVASSTTHSLNAMSKSDIKDFTSMDTTENQITTEDDLTTERLLKRDKIWGPWTTLQQCSSIIPTIDELPDEYPWELMLNLSRMPAGRRCEPGLQLQARKLLGESATSIKKHENSQDEQQNSLSQSSGISTSATITETRKIHCWINEACHTSDVKVEPPTTCFFQAIYRSPSVQVKWRRTPYGRMPSHFEVHVLDLINSVHYQKSELYVEQVKLNKFDSWGENYVVEIFGLKVGQLYEISVGSSDEMNNLYFSKSCEAIVNIGAGDGSWSKWSNWSNCNSKCASKLGTRSRYRKCDSPAPTNGGRVCPGAEQMHLECFGTNINC